jgi:hypothetical protein
MADGGGSRRQRAAGANSPAAAPVSELLQQLKALGAGAANQGGRGGGSKTYAGLAAAAGRSPPQAQAGGGAGGSAVQEPLLGRHSSGGSYSREQRGTSAFFKRQGNADPASKVMRPGVEEGKGSSRVCSSLLAFQAEAVCCTLRCLLPLRAHFCAPAPNVGAAAAAAAAQHACCWQRHAAHPAAGPRVDPRLCCQPLS